VAAKRRWGYLIWVVAGLVIGVPEITAAVDQGALPFTTISGMVGHLEHRWTWVELLVVATIVLAVFSAVRVPPKQAGDRAGDGQPARTPAGRLTLRPEAVEASKAEFDDEDAPIWFALAAVLSSVLVAVATWAAVRWWDDASHYHPAYLLYGTLALFWIAAPSILALVSAKDFPFPTLFRSVTNLEDWLRARPWPLTLGPLLGWLVAYLILAGLAILLLHLTLYPYPDITHIINPGG
jgi:hypothetical protein